MSRYALAVDIGGTFTDVVLIADDGRVWTDKTLTTHGDLLEGFFRAVDLVLGRAGIAMAAIDDVVVHATTVVTNVLIERKGPPVGLITTEGFSDVLYIRDEHRYDMYDPQIEYPDPLIPRDRTWTVAERTYADGEIGRAVSEGAVRAIAEEMLRAGIVSVAVCLLNSYRNPANEQAVREALRAAAPDLFISLSSDVAPQMREYLRTSTTAINAYTVPVTRPYLNALIAALSGRGYLHQPLIMLSSGGIVGARIAGTYPVRMIESGPAAGALVAGHFSRKLNYRDLISFDMGGTTAKACLIQDHRPLVIGDFEVDRRYRFKPGSGMPITVPSIDMIEIGAGGGSIARVDDLGLLKVGPDSAGSDPGPACYGRGGADPCVTDADVVLGIIDPAKFLGGDMPLEMGLARRALADLGEKLGVTTEKAAWGVFSVIGESMAAAARAHATDRGVNYRGLPLLAFGGAGPVHACYVAERLDSSMVVYPPMASVLSAFGTLVTPVRLDLVRSGLSMLGDLEWSSVGPLVDEMIEDGRRALEEAGISPGAIRIEFGADMRYLGQQNEVTIDFPGDPRNAGGPSALRDRFERAYEALYGVRLDDMDVEIVSWRVTAHGGNAGREACHILPDIPGRPTSLRSVHLESGPIDVPVYDRASLAPDQTIAGPVIVEERETTVFVLPDWKMRVSDDGSLIAERTA